MGLYQLLSMTATVAIATTSKELNGKRDVIMHNDNDDAIRAANTGRVRSAAMRGALEEFKEAVRKSNLRTRALVEMTTLSQMRLVEDRLKR